MERARNIPALKFAVLLSTGIFIGSLTPFNFVFLSIIVTALLAFTFFYLNKGTDEVYSFFIISVLVITFGIFKANIDFHQAPPDSIIHIPDTKQKANNQLTGIVKEIPENNKNKIRFIVRSEQIVTGERSYNVRGDVIVTLYENRFEENQFNPPDLRPGDRISLTGNLSHASRTRNPGEFDYNNYLKIHNIHRVFTVFGYENTQVISHKNLNFFEQYLVYPARQFALKNIDTHLTGDEAAYLKGLVTGERASLSDEVKEAFVNTGVMHLLAVSGLNIAFLIIIVSLTLSVFRLPKEVSLITIICVIIFYCFFTGSPASIVRAAVMGILFLTAVYMERKPDFYNIVGVAALVILLYDAKQLFDTGFILSFTAVITMVYIYEKLEKIFIEPLDLNIKKRKYIMYFIVLMLTTTAAQLGTLPITAMFFGKISLISLLANLITVPLSNIALALGLLQIAFGVFSGFLSSLVAGVNELLLAFQLGFIKFCASLDFAFIDFYGFDLFTSLIYFAVLIMLITVTKKNYKFRTTVCIILLMMAVLYKADFSNDLKVTYLDVGQGDCAIITTPTGKTIVIDCGNQTMTYNSGERTIGPYLKRNNIDKIDLLVLTHPHMDHIGGEEYLLNNFEIGKVLTNGQPYTSEYVSRVDSIIAAKNIPFGSVATGDMINTIENLRLYFLYPGNTDTTHAGEESKDLNNSSVVCKLKYMDTEFLFTGDVETESEKLITENYDSFLKSDVLKVAHHGSITSTTLPFISKNKPEYAVISCGMYNKYNHPDDIILTRLNTIGAEVFRTDHTGAVLIESDGDKIRVVDWK